MGFQVTDASGKLKVSVVANTLLSNSNTGAQNNWSPGIGDDTLISWSGASDMTVTGFAAGTSGRRLRFINTGSAVAYFSHQSGSSSAGNKLRNYVTVSTTPVAPRGSAVWEYDGTDWRLIAHEQGAWITVPYTAGDYTAATSTWTVDSGDLITFVYKLVGSTLCVRGYWDTTSVGAANNAVFVLIPNGYTVLRKMQGLALAFDGGVGTPSFNRVAAADTRIEIGRSDATNWGNTVNTTYIRVNFDFEVT